LETVAFPAGWSDQSIRVKIPENAFKDCVGLQEITLPDAVIHIGNNAFQGCTGLKTANIGVNCRSIGVSAFYGDANLTTVDRLNDSDPSHTFDTVGNYAFRGTGIRSAKLALRSSSIYTFWGDGCFQDCRQLRDVDFLSANYMSRNMFKGCTKLSSVDFNVHLMAYTYPGIFDGCTSLENITLPAEILFVPEKMFNGCTALTSVNFNGTAAIDEI